jgi:hypothetical protein
MGQLALRPSGPVVVVDVGKEIDVAGNGGATGVEDAQFRIEVDRRAAGEIDGA